MHNNSWLDKLSENPNFKSFMKKLAVTGLLLAAVGGMLKYVSHEDYGLLVMGVGMMAVVAFLLPWIFPQRNDSELEFVVKTWWRFAICLTGWGLAALLIGLLFAVSHWPGGGMLLIVGGGTLALSVLAWLWYLKRREKSKGTFNS